jgi:uncharacterized protein YqjF (DUF2071 family)
MQPCIVTVSDVCFCHWPVPERTLSRSLPDWLTIETAAGSAWITIIHTTITGIATFGVDLTQPAEAVIVRTYVRGPTGQRGLWVVAVIPGDPLTAAGATPLFRIPVRQGTPLCETTADKAHIRRTLAIDGDRVFTLRYRDEWADPSPAPPDSLPSFLTERQRYFTTGPLGGRGVGTVGHDPWNLTPIDAEVSESLLATLGLPETVDEPLCHYSPGAELSISPPRPLWLE